jgi:hypothetical protein
MGIGQVIGGALSGLGEGLEKQSILNDENQRQARLQQATTDREMALAHLNASLTDQHDAAHQAREFAYGTATNAQKQGFEQQNIRLKGSVDLSNDTVIEGLKSKYNITEDQIKSMLDLKNQLTVAGQTADHWGVTTDGRMVAFNKQGGVLRYSANPGSFVPSGESMSDSGGGVGTIDGEAASRGGGNAAGGSSSPKPAAATKPTGQPSADQTRLKAEALANLGNVYTQIAANPAAAEQYKRQYPGMFDANGNLLSKDVLIQRVNQRYGG